MDKDNSFKTFYDLLFWSINSFFIRKHLQKKKYVSWFEMRARFWSPVITNLQKMFLLDLANIFDEDTRVFSIYSYLNYLSQKEKNKYEKKIHSTKYDNLIKKLFARRWNYLAHKNKYFLNNPKELEKKFPMKYWEIEDLFKFLIKIINSTKQYFNERDVSNYIKHYSILNKDCKRDTEFIVRYWLNTPQYNAINKRK